jgi:hypothetical protein
MTWGESFSVGWYRSECQCPTGGWRKRQGTDQAYLHLKGGGGDIILVRYAYVSCHDPFPCKRVDVFFAHYSCSELKIFPYTRMKILA